MALSFDVSPADREIIDEIAERAIRLRAARRDDPFTKMDIVMDVILKRVPMKLTHHPLSSPGLTRRSILLRRRWTRGSSPRVTIGGRIKVTGTRSLVHANGNPLRLAEFRDAGAYDFAHQIIRIRANLNRENGKLENGFKPLFSAGEGA
jgi:hypothetical protein